MMTFIIFLWSVKICFPIQHRSFSSSFTRGRAIDLSSSLQVSRQSTSVDAVKYHIQWLENIKQNGCREVNWNSGITGRLSEAGNRKLIKAQWRVVCRALCFIVSKWSLLCAVSVRYHAASIINSNLHEFILQLWEFKMGSNFQSSISPGAGFKMLPFPHRFQQRGNIK